MSATKQLMTSIFFLPLKSMGSIDWLPILQNVFFCVQQKKEIHTGLERLVGE